MGAITLIATPRQTRRPPQIVGLRANQSRPRRGVVEPAAPLLSESLEGARSQVAELATLLKEGETGTSIDSRRSPTEGTETPVVDGMKGAEAKESGGFAICWDLGREGVLG